MLPSRGLRPAHIAPLASRQSSVLCRGAARKFSSFPRTSALPTGSRRTNPLQSAAWRAGAIPSSPNATLTANSVRYGSWYAPWTWGRSSTPSPDAGAIDFQKAHQSAEATSAQSAVETVTTATPELTPAGIDKAPVVESTATVQPTATAAPAQTVEDYVDQLILNNDTPAAILTSTDPLHAIEKVGTLKELGLDYGWGFTAFFEWLIENVYISSELGWGASIIVSSALIRIGCFWFQRSASDNMAKMAAVQPIVKDVQAEFSEAMRSGNSAKTEALKKKMNQIYKQAGTNPFKGFPPLIAQGLFGFGAFRCLRGMSQLPAPGLEQGGFLWFQDLTVADPYYVLPVVVGGVMHLLMKYGGETGASDQTTAGGVQFAMRTIMPAFITVVTCWQPAGTQLYFVTSTLLGAGSAKLLRTASIRQALGISPLPSAESKEFWTKVARGEISLETAEQTLAGGAPQQQAVYTAPTTPKTTPGTKGISHRGLRLKSTAAIPDHLRAAEAKIDKNNPTGDNDWEGGPPADFMGKVDWMRRNYAPRYFWNRTKLSVAKLASSQGRDDVASAVLKRKRDATKRKAEEYEERRRERLGGGRK
ncbi:hypothetical protein BU24DRAFT_487697 [Aaosphaeria arxii CBS 175.79]|uniref:Membrane insertase YidC/Oxa/ALB C-terminal domain-containing protein n=1 Tax=Aaosphaeria arxii CBS 175.79 TaxID=1450172 RepID=A0A6A5Y913_9PLEO|nr:uncharacterized protein BU24DRAFT_487697 [Aaosphaeria arxii CBS 175.79]KAF2021241.1 hypothetical protein BU24DRAFT_487697 [Aaosphaeria arxii CBS 175.79]